MRRFLLAAVCAVSASAGPCDVYATGAAPCVAAFSTLRSLFASYSGPLYVVRRASDNTTRAVPTRAPGGYADAGVQDAFCAGTDCEVWKIVDQSAFSNDLATAPPGGSARHVDNGVNASALPVRLPDGSRAYGALFVSGANQGYRIDITNSVATGNNAETVMMVTSSRAYNDKCCFDFGNAEANNLDTGEGSKCAYSRGRRESRNPQCRPHAPLFSSQVWKRCILGRPIPPARVGAAASARVLS
jgi:hypothetical protein